MDSQVERVETVEQVQRWMWRVRDAVASKDWEVAHIEEDELYVAVLRAVADGAGNAAELAAEALRSQDILDVRWYS